MDTLDCYVDLGNNNVTSLFESSDNILGDGVLLSEFMFQLADPAEAECENLDPFNDFEPSIDLLLDSGSQNVTLAVTLSTEDA